MQSIQENKKEKIRENQSTEKNDTIIIDKSNKFFEIRSRFHIVDIAVISIFSVLILLNIHFLFFFNIVQLPKIPILNSASMNYSFQQNISNSSDTVLKCFTTSGTKYQFFLINIWIFIDMFAHSLIPFIVMSLCSSIIFVWIHRTSRKYFRILSNIGQLGKNHVIRRLKRNRQLLIMILLRNCYFLVTILPYLTYFLMIKRKIIPISQPVLFTMHTLMYTNNSINFLFYGISSQKYREQLYLIFVKKKKNKIRYPIIRV